MTSSRREFSAAVGLCLLGAALVLAAGSAGWLVVQVAPRPPLPTTTLRLTGGDLVPVRALGLLALAGVVALLAAKQVGRTLVGVILLAAGVGIAALTVDVLIDPRSATTLSSNASLIRTWAPWPCALGGVLIALAGALVALRGRRWAAMSDRYDSPAVRHERAAPAAADQPMAERALWEALDNGDDPTC